MEAWSRLDWRELIAEFFGPGRQALETILLVTLLVGLHPHPRTAAPTGAGGKLSWPVSGRWQTPPHRLRFVALSGDSTPLTLSRYDAAMWLPSAAPQPPQGSPRCASSFSSACL